MSPQDVLSVLDLLGRAGVRCWLDGGWGVDALVGEQTRDHDDVDLVVLAPDLPVCRELLGAAGFAPLRDWMPTSLALRDARGREVDLHPVAPADDGGGHQELQDGATHRYGPPVVGRVAGREVLCCSVDDQLRAHTGYPLRDKDRADLAALRALPREA